MKLAHYKGWVSTWKRVSIFYSLKFVVVTIQYNKYFFYFINFWNAWNYFVILIIYYYTKYSWLNYYFYFYFLIFFWYYQSKDLKIYCEKSEKFQTWLSYSYILSKSESDSLKISISNFWLITQVYKIWGCIVIEIPIVIYEVISAVETEFDVLSFFPATYRSLRNLQFFFSIGDISG